MAWTLRYASHLGYRSPDAPLFRYTVDSADPLEQIRYAAEIGFAGVQDAWFVSRAADEQHAIARAIERCGLAAGCIVYTAREKIRQPLWASTDAGSREAIRVELTRAFESAQRIGSRAVAVLSGADTSVPPQLQFAALIENLRWASEMAAKANVVLCLESISRKSVPNMLLHHVGEAYAAVKAIDSPHVKLIFDTSHIQIMDGDLLAHLDAVWDAVELVQLADNPGRLEPGTGEINFENILRAIRAKGYRGLVELEHGWSEPSAACEQRGIDRLRDFDARS